jgi:type II secretory pathway predicted ATPase ExeA
MSLLSQKLGTAVPIQWQYTDEAVEAIYQFSGGTARLINKLCTHCLLYGAQNEHRIIDDRMVKRVIEGELS